MFKSIEYFTGSDPAPGVPIENIRPHSRRAYALMIRNRHKPLLKEGFLNVVGAIEMLGGLEYHHDNIVRLSDQLAAGVGTDETSLYHEAVAYLNRMGQFSYFARSSFVRRALPQAAAHIPTLRKYLIFRMKNAAHRSIDAPRNETEDELLSHARSLSRAWGMIMTLKPGAREFVWHGHVKADSPERGNSDSICGKPDT